MEKGGTGSGSLQSSVLKKAYHRQNLRYTQVLKLGECIDNQTGAAHAMKEKVAFAFFCTKICHLVPTGTCINMRIKAM